MGHGNVLLLGHGGSGRRSAIRLAASMIDADLFEIDANKDYDSEQWRQDIRKMLMNIGLHAKFTVFMFCNVQMVEAHFLDDISILLTTGDLPNLYPSDEKAVILDAMHNLAKQEDMKIDMTPLSLYSLFTERVRQHLRFALVISALSEEYRKCFIIYPALNNFCTLDWFNDWPDDALEHVAKKFIVAMNLSSNEATDAPTTDLIDQKPVVEQVTAGEESDDDANAEMSELETNLVQIVVYFNRTMRAACEKYANELTRQTYIVPTAYIQMLQSFSSLYVQKNNEITNRRDRYAYFTEFRIDLVSAHFIFSRYTIGLEKLDHAAGQVQEMQQNLFDLQPKLKQLSDETEKIMVEIERDTAEAEKKKEVVGADEAAANEVSSCFIL